MKICMLLPQCVYPGLIICQQLISLSSRSVSAVLWPCEAVCSAAAGETLDGALGAQVTLSFEDTNRKCSSYRETLTEEILLQLLVEEHAPWWVSHFETRWVYYNSSNSLLIDTLIWSEPAQTEWNPTLFQRQVPTQFCDYPSKMKHECRSSNQEGQAWTLHDSLAMGKAPSPVLLGNWIKPYVHHTQGKEDLMIFKVVFAPSHLE